MTFDEFFSQYSALMRSVPQHPTHSFGNENSDFVSYTYRSSSCYYCFDSVDCKNCLYCFDGVRSTDIIDGDYCVECEMLYESVDAYRCYNSSFLTYCARIYDSYYCRNCFDGHDLFGCVDLKQKQYCIFNVQYTKEEYGKKLKALIPCPPQEHLAKVEDLKKNHPLGPTFVTHSQNSDYGNQVHYCTNCYLCFDTARSKDLAYTYDTAYCSYSMDLTYCYKAELCYESTGSTKIYNCDFVDWSTECFDSSYLVNCKDCHYCFGCVCIQHKKNCILNKQYSAEAYKKIIGEIIASRLASFTPKAHETTLVL